jgi:hypothetical protein
MFGRHCFCNIEHLKKNVKPRILNHPALREDIVCLTMAWPHLSYFDREKNKAWHDGYMAALVAIGVFTKKDHEQFKREFAETFDMFD